jgi:hypothetical protein
MANATGHYGRAIPSGFYEVTETANWKDFSWKGSRELEMADVEEEAFHAEAKKSQGLCNDVPSNLASRCRFTWNSEAKPIQPYIEIIKPTNGVA